MKRKYFLISIILVLTNQACTDSSVHQAYSTRRKLEANLWKIQRVEADGIDQSQFFTGMTLKFDEGIFMVMNGGAIWPDSDTWELVDSNNNAFIRGDDTIVTIQSISSTKLVLVLSWDKTTLGGGRIQSISGEYSFIFGI